MQQFKLESENAIAKINNKEISHSDFKDIICTIASMLKALCANLPVEVPFIIKEIICLIASLAETLCKLLSDS